MKNAKIATKARGKKVSIEKNDINLLADEDEDRTYLVTNKRSINITEEALALGKLPTEEIAFNISKNLYSADGRLKGGSRKEASPRI